MHANGDNFRSGEWRRLIKHRHLAVVNMSKSHVLFTPYFLKYGNNGFWNGQSDDWAFFFSYFFLMFPRVHWNPLKTKTVNSAVQICWASVHLERCGRKCILSCQTLNNPGKIHANRRQGGRVCVFGVTFRAFISASKSKRNLIFFRTSTKQAHRRWCLLSKPFSASFPLPPSFPVNLFAYSRTFKRKRANFSRCRPGVESHRGGGK